MAHYALKIYQRRRPNETVGSLVESIEFDAPDNQAATHEAYAKLDGLNWTARFAALWSDDNQFLAIWAAPPHA